MMTWEALAQALNQLPSWEGPSPLWGEGLQAGGGGYSGWLRFEQEMARRGLQLNQAFWPCPIDGRVWHDCPHVIWEAYPGAAQRPRLKETS